MRMLFFYSVCQHVYMKSEIKNVLKKQIISLEIVLVLKSTQDLLNYHFILLRSM